MRTYYHYCVRVLVWDDELQNYKLWYIESFSSKRLYEIWSDGFRQAMDMRVYPFRVKLGETFVKYRTYKPKY